MAITHVTALRNALALEVSAAADAGTTNASARFQFLTSGDVPVATCNMSNPAFGAPSTGTITAAAIADDESAAGGTIAKFRIIDRDGNEVIRGTAGTSGTDVIITSTEIGAGDTVIVDSFSYTAPV